MEIVVVTANSLTAATANSAAIQTAINAGGVVNIDTPGTIWTNRTHILPSNTEIILGEGTTLKSATGTICNIFRNQMSANAVLAANLAHAGGVVTVIEGGHTRNVGDAVYVAQVTGDTSLNGLFTVATSNPTAGTWTYAVAGSGTPTGFAWIYNASAQIPIANFLRAVTSATVTISIPGGGGAAIVTLAANGRSVNDPVVFTTTGALPTGITAGAVYYISSRNLQPGVFGISVVPNGPQIVTTGTQSGVHTMYYGTVAVTESGHSKRPGDAVWIGNLTGARFTGAFEILSTTTNTWTFVSPGSTTAPTGGPAVVLADRNITITGGAFDGNIQNNPQSPDTTQTLIYLQNISSSRVKSVRGFNHGFRTVFIANSCDCVVDDVYGENALVNVQFEAPWNRLMVSKIRGRGLDDVLAFTNTLATSIYASVASPSGNGNCGFVSVRDVFSKDTLSTLKISGTAGYSFGVFAVDGVMGTALQTNGKLVSIVDDSAALTGGAADIIRLKNVYGTNFLGVAKLNYTMTGAVNLLEVDGFEIDGALYGVSFAAGTIGSAVFKNITGAVSTGNIGIVTSNPCTIAQLLFDDCDVGIEGNAPFYQNQGAAIARIKCNKINATGPWNSNTGGSAGTFLFHNTGTIGEIDLSNFSIFGAGTIYAGGQSSGTVNMRWTNIKADEMGSIWGGGVAGGTTHLSIVNMDVGFVGNNVFQVNAGTVRVCGQNMALASGGWVLLNSGSSSISLNAPDISIDLGANGATNPTGLAPVAGDQLTNTNGTGAGRYGRTAAGAWTKLY